MPTSTNNFPVPTCAPRNWHCTKCFALLGKRQEHRVHLKTTRGVEYFADLPCTAVCRCGCLNELGGPGR